MSEAEMRSIMDRQNTDWSPFQRMIATYDDEEDKHDIQRGEINLRSLVKI